MDSLPEVAFDHKAHRHGDEQLCFIKIPLYDRVQDVLFQDEPGPGKRGIMLQYLHGAQVPRIKIAQTALYYKEMATRLSY